MKPYTIKDFNRDFPNDAACLDWLKNYLYPNGITCENKTCPRQGQVTKHYRDLQRRSYSCAYCGHHVHPTAGTFFHKSPTLLRLWFYAIYQMSSTRCGISAKQIQRETGVTYKTAWRMFRQIRTLLSEEGLQLEGSSVEMDEMYHGGKRRHEGGQGRPSHGSHKVPVIGMVERRTDEKVGRALARVAPDATRQTLHGLAKEYILPASTVFTDDFVSYDGLQNLGYVHKRIRHSAKVYVVGDVHTQNVDGFWSLIKRGIGGVYHNVSAKYLQTYLDEYTFRFNRRDTGNLLFKAILQQVSRKA